jgi:hypothetical protein
VPREPLVQERVVGVQNIEHIAIFSNNAVEKQFRFALECLPQVVVKIGINQQVRIAIPQLSKIQPLARKIRDQRLRPAILQHPPHLLLQNRRILQPALFGRGEQLLIRDAAPQKE